MKWDDTSDRVIMIVMLNENKARFCEPENILCKGASILRWEWLEEEISLKFGVKLRCGESEYRWSFVVCDRLVGQDDIWDRGKRRSLGRQITIDCAIRNLSPTVELYYLSLAIGIASRATHSVYMTATTTSPIRMHVYQAAQAAWRCMSHIGIRREGWRR